MAESPSGPPRSGEGDGLKSPTVKRAKGDTAGTSTKRPRFVSADNNATNNEIPISMPEQGGEPKDMTEVDELKVLEKNEVELEEEITGSGKATAIGSQIAVKNDVSGGSELPEQDAAEFMLANSETDNRFTGDVDVEDNQNSLEHFAGAETDIDPLGADKEAGDSGHSKAVTSASGSTEWLEIPGE